MRKEDGITQASEIKKKQWTGHLEETRQEMNREIVAARTHREIRGQRMDREIAMWVGGQHRGKTDTGRAEDSGWNGK